MQISTLRVRAMRGKGWEMKERPILFSGPMVRAILEGRKTQTRRVVKQPLEIGEKDDGTKWPFYPAYVAGGAYEGQLADSPHGIPGDRLWVRETWTQYNESTPADDAKAKKAWESFTSGEKGIVDAALDLPTPSGSPRALYAADFDAKNVCWNWRPSIFMPRWASRITLEITDVRVQRLQEISEEDAQAEGIERIPNSEGPNFFSYRNIDFGWHNAPTAKECFHDLWDSINTKRGFGWDANPWVWALTFRRLA